MQAPDIRNRAVGLVLTGGGARGAYQAGVVKGVAQIAAERGVSRAPFTVVSGASAGAVNAAFVAAAAAELGDAAPKLANFWAGLATKEIFRTDALSLGRIGLRWAGDLVFGAIKKKKRAQSLLDTAPLRKLIAARVPFERIETNVTDGVLRAVELTATDYHNSESISFITAADKALGWTLARRRSAQTLLGIDHVMASSAIPLLFPPVCIGDRHFGDGCLRNSAPLGPAIRLGAERLLIVGVRHAKSMAEINAGIAVNPTIGRVLSVLLNAVLMDATEFDIERLERYNEILRRVPAEARSMVSKREIEFLHIRPSVDLGAFAAEHFERLPDMLRYLISGLGNRNEASELVSYLFFENVYTGYLVDVGYKDALAQRGAIENLLFA